MLNGKADLLRLKARTLRKQAVAALHRGPAEPRQTPISRLMADRRGFIFGAIASTMAMVKADPAAAWLKHGIAAGGGGAVAPYATPGTITLGNTWAADTYNTQEGTALQEGYAYTPAGCTWATPRYDETVTVSGVANDLWIGVVGAGTPTVASYLAGDVFCNLKKVQVSIGGGPWCDITAPTVQPVTGILAWHCRVKATDATVSGVFEVRARVIPMVGLPYLLQGADPLSFNVCYADATSSAIVIDRNDGTISRLNLYKQANSDALVNNDPAHGGTNTGLTSGSPLYEWDTVASKMATAGANCIAKINMLSNQDHEWGATGADVSTIIESNYGWTVVTPAPGLTAADVKINRDLGFRRPFRKLFLKGFTLGDVFIRNSKDSGDTYLHTRQQGLVEGRAHVVGTLHLTSTVTPTTTSASWNSNTMNGPDIIMEYTQASKPTGDPTGWIPSDPSNGQYSLHNTGSNPVYVNTSLGAGGTATTSDTLVAAGATVAINMPDPTTQGVWLNMITTGGPTTVQITALNYMANSPLNPKWVEGCKGVVEVMDQTIAWSADSSCFAATYIRNVTLDTIANNGDAADNVKFIAGLTIKNFATGLMFANHLDAIQPIHGGASNVQHHKWYQDITCLQSAGAYLQYLLGDSSNAFFDSVLLRHKARSISAGFWFQGAAKNMRFIYPDIGGFDKVTTLGYNDPSNTWWNAPYEHMFFLYDSAGIGVGGGPPGGGNRSGSNFEAFYRQGVKLFYPFTTTFPNPGNAVPVPTLVSLLSGKNIVQVFDPDQQEFIGRTHRDLSDPANFFTGLTKTKWIANAAVPELEMGSREAGNRDNLVQSGTPANWPTTVEGTHRGILYGGTHLLGGNIPSKDQLTNINNSTLARGDQATVILAWNVDASDTSGNAHHFWNCGRLDPASVFLAHKFAGGRHQLSVGCGQADVTLASVAGISLDSGAGNPDASGPCVMILDLMTDRIRLTYYSTGNTGGTMVETVFATANAAKPYLAHQLVNGQMQSLGGITLDREAIYNSTGCKGTFYGGTWSEYLDATTRANILADLRARVGI